MRSPLFLVACLALLSCSASSTPSNVFDTGDSGGAGGDTGAGGSAAAGKSGAAGNPGGAGSAGDGTPIVDPSGDTGCGDVGKVIFVVSEENVMLSFDPQTLKFTKLGTLSCPSAASPFSMAVDRKGVAFVLYSDGNIFKVQTSNPADCQNSGYAPDQKGWNVFGMGWVSDAQGSDQETLFVIDGDGGPGGLGKINNQGKLQTVADFDSGLQGHSAEVTGRGDGKLFGFFVDAGTSKSSVAEIDRNTAHIISNVAQNLPPISAWAFAHWGGSFYLFNGDSGSSHVHKFTPGKGTTQVVADAGYRIVGAGVSTCAPTEPPIN
jgi:hypothetical protein